MTFNTARMQAEDMTFAPLKQGYLGDLRNKTIPELKELLERQEKILMKRKFLDRLPDKGEKARAFAVFLKHLIEEKSRGISSSPAFTDLMTGISEHSQNSVSAENKSPHFQDNVVINDADVDDDHIISQQESSSNLHLNIENSSAMADETVKMDCSSPLVSELGKMSLGTVRQGSQGDGGQFINSYERVIKKKEIEYSNQKPKFLPNRTLVSDHIPPSPYTHETKHKKTNIIEESAANPPFYKHQASELIPIEESIKLIDEQRALNLKLFAQRAAKRLADQLFPKMDVYSPPSPDMQYREAQEHDKDSDDDDDNASQDEDADVD